MKKEKIFNIILLILIFLAIFSTVLLNPLSNLDEIWNYNFARNMADGLVPYKDFSMLQMPLLPIICGIILKVFANQLIVMRILAALLCSAILYITYRVFSILNIKKEISVIFLFIIGCLFKNLFCIDYNFATLLLVLIIILKEIKAYQSNNDFLLNQFKTDLLLGILAGLTVTLKQTTGIFVCLALLGNKLLFVKNKEDFKLYIKVFCARLVGVLIPIVCILVYLMINGAFQDFVSYTIKGMSGFSNYISYINLIKGNLIGILSILVPIMFVCAWIKSIVMEKDKITYLLLVYGLAMFVVCFPISDEIHFLIGALPTLILIVHELYCLGRKLLQKHLKEKILKVSLLFAMVYILLFLIYYSFVNFNQYWGHRNSTSDLEHYIGIPIDKSFEKEIEKIDEYLLKHENVKILDASAAVYMIPINQYHKNYDMFLKGNLGEDGETKIIEEISKTQDTQYFILKDRFHKNWQTPLDVIDYVKNNKKKVGEIEIFDIYE